MTSSGITSSVQVSRIVVGVLIKVLSMQRLAICHNGFLAKLLLMETTISGGLETGIPIRVGLVVASWRCAVGHTVGKSPTLWLPMQQNGSGWGGG